MPKEGETAVLSCLVSGKPTPDVEWSFNGKPLPRESKTHKTRAWDDGTHSIEISNVKQNLCGVYTAKATNSLGVAQSSATLGIAGEKAALGVPAGFTTPPQDKITVNEGEQLKLTCQVKGEPQPRGRC